MSLLVPISRRLSHGIGGQRLTSWLPAWAEQRAASVRRAFDSCLRTLGLGSSLPPRLTVRSGRNPTFCYLYGPLGTRGALGHLHPLIAREDSRG